MRFLLKIVGFLPALCMFDAGAAVRAGAGGNTNSTGRISVSPSIGVTSTAGMAAARRLPTMVSAKNVAAAAIAAASVNTTTSSSSSLMTERECVDAYTECIKDADVCGIGFEECTTSELFYAKKPQCNSVLLQCDATGINTLFGTSNTDNLATKNTTGEYVYPTASSILGQFIEAGAINNRLDTTACVKRYTSCLKKESVCGEDFELCTSNAEFKKQKIFCESTLARCQDGGLNELLGSTNASANPTSASRIGVMIREGADLAAVNAVSTCYKVADQCILSACTANPYKCIVDSNTELVMRTDDINEDNTVKADTTGAFIDAITTSTVSRYIRSSCAETIGGNKYCYMTVNDGRVPTASQINDEENRSDVYSDIYSARMNSALREKIQKLADTFDKKTKDKCSDTITACAMRSCGSGLGSACYALVFGSGRNCFDGTMGGGTCSINGNSTYNEVKIGCESIVNTDANCKYAAASVGSKTYGYEYNTADAFDRLFPALENGTDPIGVVSRLNASLAENYNNAAIERMAKQCKNTAVSCIRSLCGSDFTNCYRNRTDVMADTYDTGNAAFDNSMNKLGGVLDFNIVRGLCVSTVKDADSCEEHLKIQAIKKYTDGNGKTGWGDNKTVRDAWVGAVKDGYKQTGSYDTRVLMGCTVKSGTSDTCDAKVGNVNLVEDCGTVDEDGCMYDVEYYMTETDYAFSMSVDTLFQEVLGDIEKEAQAKYNAKLTREQNMCVSANSGGIMGNREMSGTYQWVKLKSKRIPKNYSTAGLKINDFVASNDLYGSFCRARVTIQSDDPDIQSALQSKQQNWSTAYFAVGDVFTCGSWIPQNKLQEIATKVACKRAKANGTIKADANCDNAESIGLTNGQKWAVAATAIGTSGLGIAGMELLQSKTGLGGLLGTSADTRDTACNDAKVYIYQLQGWIADAETKAGKNCKITADGVIRKSNFGRVIQKIKAEIDVATSSVTCGSAKDILNAEKDNAEAVYKEMCGDKGNGKNPNIGARIGADVLGAAAIAIPSTFAVRDAIRNGNRAKFTADEEEFMRNVGEHIYCFIGADEAGTYGDLIEISVE